MRDGACFVALATLPLKIKQEFPLRTSDSNKARLMNLPSGRIYELIIPNTYLLDTHFQ